VTWGMSNYNRAVLYQTRAVTNNARGSHGTLFLLWSGHQYPAAMQNGLGKVPLARDAPLSCRCTVFGSPGCLPRGIGQSRLWNIRSSRRKDVFMTTKKVSPLAFSREKPAWRAVWILFFAWRSASWGRKKRAEEMYAVHMLQP